MPGPTSVDVTGRPLLAVFSLAYGLLPQQKQIAKPRAILQSSVLESQKSETFQLQFENSSPLSSSLPSSDIGEDLRLGSRKEGHQRPAHEGKCGHVLLSLSPRGFRV